MFLLGQLEEKRLQIGPTQSPSEASAYLQGSVHHCHGDSAVLHTEDIAHANAFAELAPWMLEMSWIASCGESAGTTTTNIVMVGSPLRCLLGSLG